VGAGYLLDPDLTARKFVPDPFSREPGQRLYRTGDLVRCLPDGNVEFLRRIDHQVKVRGYRIELGEIEAALAQQPSVREAVVVARDGSGGDKRLVAYIVPADPQASVPLTEVRRHLKERLPDYMIPAGIVWLPALPLTPSGKVDRRALPAAEESPVGPESARVSPRNPTEERLVRLWEGVLGVSPIGVTDDFFDLGGHSLLAVRVFFEIKKEFGRDLPLSTLFQDATVEGLARVLADSSPAPRPAILEPIQPKGSRRPLFVASGPNANALGYALLSRYLGDEQPVYGLQSRYRTDVDRPYTQAEHEALAAEYLRALQAVQPRGPYHLAGMCVGSYIALEMARQLEAKGEAAGLLAVFDTWPVENTANRLWYIHNGIRCLQVLYRADWRGQLRFLRDKGRDLWRSVCNFLSPDRRRTEAGTAGNPFIARYWPGPGFEPPRFAGRITLFRTRKQPYYRVRDPEMGWGPRAERGVEVHTIPGTHRTMLREPNVQVLAARLRECLDRAQADA
jgi:thioesterase domain-containing protein